MKHYPKHNWIFNGILECRDHRYKYYAILRNDNLDVTELVPFGNVKSSHFYDLTKLNNYSHLNTNNIKDRMDFILKNVENLKTNYYSQTYFELKFLYNYVSCE